MIDFRETFNVDVNLSEEEEPTDLRGKDEYYLYLKAASLYNAVVEPDAV